MSAVNSTNRLASLDAFRGFTIASMVLVNNPGDWGNIYKPLGHAEWHGWTFTDWVFPFFLFIGGVSMTISLGKRAASATNSSSSDFALLLHLWKRALIIIAIGVFLNAFPVFEWDKLRIPGVLQRIGLCVIVTAPIAIYCDWKTQVGWIVALWAVYSALMLAVPVPDVNGVVAAGALEAGRDFGAYVDRIVLGGHLWAKVKTWDPEGLVSTIPAVTSMLFGLLVGRWLATNRERAEKTVWMLIAGLGCLWLGEVLAAWNMPINKNLWTPAYAAAMTGWGLLVFGVFYWLMDATASSELRKRSAQWFKPFTIYGMNALFIFALSAIVGRLLGFIKFDGGKVSLKQVLYEPLKSLPLAPVNQSLVYAILFNVFMFGIAYLMWKKKWFVKI
jgi:predicted acyltransferase